MARSRTQIVSAAAIAGLLAGATFGTTLTALVGGSPAKAADTPKESVDQRVARLEAAVTDLQAQVKQLKAQPITVLTQPVTTPPAIIYQVPSIPADPGAYASSEARVWYINSGSLAPNATIPTMTLTMPATGRK